MDIIGWCRKKIAGINCDKIEGLKSWSDNNIMPSNYPRTTPRSSGKSAYCCREKKESINL
jgi:hypothetical protein